MNKLKSGAALCGLIVTSHVCAQSASPALPPSVDPAAQDAYRQQREQRIDAREKAMPAATPAVEQDVQGNDAGPAFVVRSIRFTKSDHLSREQLTQAAQPFLNREIRMQDLQALLDKINALYRSMKIFTAVATLPEQRVEEGKVVIRLVEGRVARTLVEGNSYLADDYIRPWIADVVKDGALDAPLLEASIERFNRLNDASLRATLRAGEEFGKTEIVLAVTEPPRNSFHAFVDNYGYQSSGKTELGVILRRQKLVNDGDRGWLYGMASQGIQAFSASYNAPMGTSGTRLGASASVSRVRVVEGSFQDVAAQGSGYSAALDASHLLRLSPGFSLSLTGNLGYSRSSTDVSGVAVSDYGITKLSGALALTVGGNGWQWMANPALNAMHAANKLLPDLSMSVFSLTGDTSLVRRFGAGGWYGLGQLNWQWTSKSGLPGALSYLLGGPVSMRGYQPGQISGDKGYAASLELHYDGWSSDAVRTDVFGFIDAAAAYSINPVVRPMSAGIGVSWSGWHGMHLTLTAAKAMKDVVPDQENWIAFARLSREF